LTNTTIFKVVAPWTTKNSPYVPVPFETSTSIRFVTHFHFPPKEFPFPIVLSPRNIAN